MAWGWAPGTVVCETCLWGAAETWLGLGPMQGGGRGMAGAGAEAGLGLGAAHGMHEARHGRAGTEARLAQGARHG